MPYNDYLARINKVIDHIQISPEGDLSLHELAKVASFSPFHFHRIFKAVVGESVNDYVKRSRLERAAKRLVSNKNSSITTIAMDTGFTSLAVFSRSFKEHFGTNPSEFRQRYVSKNCKIESNHCKETPLSIRYDVFSEVATKLNNKNQRSVSPMHIEIKVLPTFHVAYVRHLEGYEKGIHNSKISDAFNKAYKWIEAKQLMDQNTLFIGVFYDHQDITPNEKRRYDASITIPDHITEGSEGISIQNIEGGQYAICRIEVENEGEDSFGKAIAKMDQGFEYIYGTWLPESMYELQDKPCLEFYLSPKNSKTHIIEACVPIKTL